MYIEKIEFNRFERRKRRLLFTQDEKKNPKDSSRIRELESFRETKVGKKAGIRKRTEIFLRKERKGESLNYTFQTGVNVMFRFVVCKLVVPASTFYPGSNIHFCARRECKNIEIETSWPKLGQLFQHSIVMDATVSRCDRVKRLVELNTADNNGKLGEQWRTDKSGNSNRSRLSTSFLFFFYTGKGIQDYIVSLRRKILALLLSRLE